MQQQTLPEQLIKKLNISCLENLVHEAKQLVNTVNPLQSVVVVRAADINGNSKYTHLYQGDAYVYVAPQGETEKALLYGNWEEALHASKRILKTSINSEQPTISIDHYHSVFSEVAQ